MEMKHTPGPWAWSGNDLEGGDYKSVIESEVSCSAFCYGGCVSMTISDADKALVAAAPDLLAALIGLRASFSEYIGPNSEAADAAIAKATGSKA